MYKHTAILCEMTLNMEATGPFETQHVPTRPCGVSKGWSSNNALRLPLAILTGASVGPSFCLGNCQDSTVIRPQPLPSTHHTTQFSFWEHCTTTHITQDHRLNICAVRCRNIMAMPLPCSTLSDPSVSASWTFRSGTSSVLQLTVPGPRYLHNCQLKLPGTMHSHSELLHTPATNDRRVPYFWVTSSIGKIS
jgi:hypothetical protein